MLKRAVAIMLWAAFLTATSTAIMTAPGTQAEAAAAKAKPGMSFRERQKACSAEWKEAKAAQKTKGMKWPKFWSDCNKWMKTKSG